MNSMKVISAEESKEVKRQKLKSYLKNNWHLYVMILPVVIYFIVFNYLPMYGIQIAFKDYKAALGISRSPWVGLKHFTTFFNESGYNSPPLGA